MADEFPTQQPAYLSDWNFSMAIVAPPATMEVRLNANNQKNPTRLWVSKITANGIDATAYLEVVKVGDVLTLRDKSNPTIQWHQYGVSAAPIKQTDYWEYPVLWQAGGTNLIAGRVTLETPTVNVSTNVTAAPLMQTSVGTVAVTTTRNPSVYAATSPAMQVLTDRVEIVGQLMTFDYAYPFQGKNYTSPGMTIRQYYAGQALAGFIAGSPAQNLMGGKVAEYCFKVADSLIKHEANEEAGVIPPAVGGPPPVAGAQIRRVS